MRRTSRKLLENETTDEHGAAQPQPKLGDSSRLRGKRRAKSTTKTRRREESRGVFQHSWGSSSECAFFSLGYLLNQGIPIILLTAAKFCVFNKDAFAARSVAE